MNSSLSKKGMANIPMKFTNKRSIKRIFRSCKDLQRQKRKTDLVEMVLFGHIIDKLNKMGIEGNTKNEAKQILQRFNIRVRSLLVYGNVGLKRKEILALAEQNSRTSIELID